MSTVDSKFLEAHKNRLDDFGFWEEEHKSSLIIRYMTQFKTEIIRDYMVTDFVMKDKDHILVKWIKRHEPLSDEEVLEKWNRDVNKGE